MFSIHYNLSIILCFLQMSEYCICTSPIYNSQVIYPNNVDFFSLSTKHYQKFQIPAISSNIVGNFDVSIVSIGSKVISHLISNLRICNDNSTSIEIELEYLSYFQQETTFSFIGNASNTHCFDLKVAVSQGGSGTTAKNHAISVLFTPIRSSIEIDGSFELELEKDEEKEFFYEMKDLSAKVIYIHVQNTSALLSNNINLEIKYAKGTCIESYFSSFKTWLCDFSFYSRKIFKFSLIDRSRHSGRYKISLSTVELKKVTPNLSVISYPFIPGFGSIFSTSLSSIGVLKIKAISQNSDFMALIGANSLAKLFESLAQKKDENCTRPGVNEEVFRHENNYVNSELYYFIPDKSNSKYFYLESQFVHQLDVDIQTDVMYYIDPSKSFSQHTEFRFPKFNTDDKYEVTLEAQQPNSLMDLIFSSFNPLNNKLPILFNNNSYSKELLDWNSNKDKIEMSFKVKEYNTSLYMTTYAAKKGFYLLRVNKVRYEIGKDTLTVLAFLAPLIMWAYFVLRKIASNNKKSKIHRPSDLPLTIINQSNILIESEENIESEISNDIIEIDNQYSHGSSMVVSSWKNIDELNFSKESRCDICYEQRETLRFLPCNHACACNFCAVIIIETSLKCPLCRSRIQEVRLS